MSFKSSLRMGRVGELMFYQAHNGTLEQLDGYMGEFVCRESGSRIELKSDFYTMDETPNLFMERYGNKEKQSDGGPWKALADGCNIYTYFYVPSLTYFVFDTRKLVARLEEIIPTLKPYEVRNTGYITVGYRVARELLTDLADLGRIEVNARLI